MAKLPTYTAPLGEIAFSGGRRAGAEDFGAGVGASLQVVAKDANKVYDDIGDAESRKSLVSTSEIRAKYAQRLDAAALNGEDLDKIKVEMNNELSKVSEQFRTTQGQSSNDYYTATTNAMFDQQANSVAVQRATMTAKVEAGKFLNSTSALINTNPAYLKVAEADATAFAATLSNVPPEKRAEIEAMLHNELNASAAIASARIDPQGTITRLEAGDWNLTADQRNVALNTADREINSRRTQENYQRQEKERFTKEQDKVARGEHFTAIMSGTASWPKIRDDHRLEPDTKEHLVYMMEARAKEQANKDRKSVPTVLDKLWGDVNAPPGDPRKIYNPDSIFKAVMDGTLTTTDADRLIAAVSGQKDEDGRKFSTRLESRLATQSLYLKADIMLSTDPDLSAAIINQMRAEVEDKSAAMRREGANGRDPTALLDSSSKDYYFTAGKMKQVEMDVRAQMKAAIPADRKMPDARTAPVSDIIGLPDGAAFYNPKGVAVRMTPELRKALQKQQPAPKEMSTEERYKLEYQAKNPPTPKAKEPVQIAPAVSSRLNPASEFAPAPKAAPPVVAPVPTKGASRAELLQDSIKIREDYIKALDDFLELNKQKNPDNAKLRAARSKMEELKKKSEAASDAWKKVPE
jgi:hypothetical protein